MPSLTSILLLALLPVSLHAAEKLQFNRDIRPILSDKCFHCHGFDPKTREADLRLDERDPAIEAKAILPGKADASAIIERILATDDDHMPPAKSKLDSLTPKEVATLKQWINEGAEYEKHWAFEPLKASAIKDTSIDKIVSAGLHAHGLKLQPKGDASTLIRRLSFDLTGLPPSPEQVTQFTADYARDPTSSLQHLASSLAASPRYGERMAVDWLDVSRYADSYGFQVDRERDVWVWRDWVIKSFNDNLPFDQFITWQVAGDLLPNATDEQILATAFNRLHQQESEGGSVEEEYRVEYVADRVQTFATAFLGLTFECARCHDHKFDPIKQTDYYGLFAMFQNIDEAGLYSYFTQTPPTPALMLTDAGQKQKLAALKAEVARVEESTPAIAAQILLSAMNPNAKAHFTFDTLDKNQLANSTDPKQPASLKGENKLVAGRTGQAIQFTGDDPVDLPLGNYHACDPFSVSLWLKTPDVKERAVVFHRSRAWTDAGSRGYELLIEEGKLKWSLIHFWPGNAISIRSKTPLKINEWTQVTVTNDGSSRAAGLKLFVNGKPAEVDILKDQLTRDITGGGGDNISLGERFRDRGFKGGFIDDFQVFDRDVSDPREPSTLAALKQARADLIAFTNKLPDLMVMQELPKPKKAYLLTRGEYDKRTDEVPMHAPHFLPPLPAGAPVNRLGLAQWLTAPNHPLTARVIVNRVWQSLFGRGLVKTSEDFGSQGERPIYPELLDYLSLKFIRSGWDMKALIQEIVLSDVYQQRSLADATTMADDPDNQWLARGPRFRLPAEMIRDNALATAGLLKLDLGGPPVNPYELSEGFKPANPTDPFRRSVYATWRRTSPPPAMVAFDAPRRAVCSAKRERTDSPLQALILLNGVQYVEAARVLGEKLHLDTKGDVSKMIEQGFLRCLSRKPDAQEVGICTQLYREQLQHFQVNAKDAEALLKIGKTKRNDTLPLPEAAAATVLAQALMNHDACVVKR